MNISFLTLISEREDYTFIEMKRRTRERSLKGKTRGLMLDIISLRYILDIPMEILSKLLDKYI